VRRSKIGQFHKASLLRYVPHVAVTTLAVVVLPVLIVTALRDLGIIVGILPLLVAGLTLSLSISLAGSAIWRTRSGSGDILFADLIVWGFVRRWRVDRRLSSAIVLLGPHRDAEEAEKLDLAAKAALLAQLAGALEARDPYTHGHSRRVARHTMTIAMRLGLPREEISRIRAAAAIHDVGKVNTPREILTKPSPLSEEEFEVVKRHAVDGGRMAGDLEDPELARIVRHHHERIDGGGYPDGLAGDEIPLGSRIIAVADSFDAITSARPYRPAKSHGDALRILRAESGTQLDPNVVEAFRSYYSGLRPVAVWTALAGIPQRLFPGIFDGLGPGVVSSTKAAAAATASAIVAATAVNGGGLAHPSSGQADWGPGQATVRAESDTPSRSAGSLTVMVEGKALGDGGGSGASPGLSPHLTPSSDAADSSPADSATGSEPASGGTSKGSDSPGRDEAPSAGGDSSAGDHSPGHIAHSAASAHSASGGHVAGSELLPGSGHANGSPPQGGGSAASEAAHDGGTQAGSSAGGDTNK
jgi:hypothetical protein